MRASIPIGSFGKLERGWNVGIRSFRVLVAQPELLAFPVMAAVCLLAVGLAVLLRTPVVGWAAGLSGNETATNVVLLVATFVGIFVTTAVSTFFNAAVVHASRRALSGEDPSVRESLGAALGVIDRILVWALVAATVGLVLRTLERRDPRVGELVAAVLGAAWGIATYFVVPVLVFEDGGIGETFARSASTMRDAWGETAGASVGVGAVIAVGVFLALVVAFVLSFLVLPALVCGFAAVLVVVGLVIATVAVVYPVGQTVSAVVKTALYLYAEERRTPRAFEGVDLGPALE